MTRTRLRRRLSAAPWLAAALILTLLTPSARAQFAFTAPAGAVSGGTITAHPGDTLTFVGTLTNNYDSELDNVTIAPQFTAGNARYFPSYDTQIAVFGFPETFKIGDSAPSHKLTITVTSSTPPGNYAFYFDANAAGDGNGNFTGDIFSDNYILAVVSTSTVPPPTNLTALGGEKQVMLNWTAPAGVTGATYNVYRGTAAGGESATPVATSLSATTYTDTALTDGTAYFYTVKTVTSGGSSVASNEASATPFLAPPTALTATGGTQSVSLTWTAPAGVTGATYNVYRGTTAGGEAATPIVTGLSMTTYTDTPLADGTAYFYTVKTVANGDVSAASNEATATTTAAVPPPTNLTATGGEKQVVLNWTAPAGVTGATYNVYRGTAAGGESATAIATGLTATTYTDSGLTDGTAYFYTVKTVANGNSSVASNEAAATPSLAAPTALTAAGGEKKVTLNWTAPAGVTGATYSVYRGTTAGGEAATPIATNLSATVYTDSGLTDGTTYFYVVKAMANGDVSAPSNEASATANPTPPTALAAAAAKNVVTLTWTATVTGTGVTYNVYRGTTAGGESATPIAKGVKASPFTDTRPLYGAANYYVVRTVVGTAVSGPSNEASVTPVLVAPVAPVLTAVAGNATVSVTWTAPAGTASYTLYRGVAGTTPTVLVTGYKSTTYHDTTVTNGTVYAYYVVAVDAAGSSPNSNTVSVTPDPAPAAPTGLTATAGSKKITLAWTAPAGPVTSYSIFRGLTAGGESATALKTGVTTTVYADTTAKVGTAYFYVVKAVNGAGASPASNEASATATP